MKKKVVSGEYIVTSPTLECIELRENGVLIISNDLKELTIQQLINEKEPECLINYEILVTGKEGEDAPYGSGQNGADGGNGGNVKITVEDLIGDVRIRAQGGCGGCGGSGKDGENGGDGSDGGNGGNGGDGAVIDFTYDKKTNRDGMNFAYVESFSGGVGGMGGAGGNCIQGGGRGGQPGKSGGHGAKCGNGGCGGRNGKDGIVTIHHPDGSTTCTQNEWNDSGNAVPRTMFQTIDYSDDAAFRKLLSAYGGELGLERFPKFKAAIQKTRERAKLLCRGERQTDQSDQVWIEGSVSPLNAIPVSSDEADSKNDSQDELADFYQMTCQVSTIFANSSNVVTQEGADDATHVAGYVAQVYLYAKDLNDPAAEEIILYRSTLFSEDEGEEFKPCLQTDVLPTYCLLNQSLEMRGTVTYLGSDQIARSCNFRSASYPFEKSPLESPIDRIFVTDPHWKKEEKEGNSPIVFLYGRTPNDNPEYRNADYWGGCYLENNNKSILHTIIPVSGTISLLDKFSVKSVKLGSYEDGNGDGHCNPPVLEYMLNGQQKTIARFHWNENDKTYNDLVEKMRQAGSISYDSENKIINFDLKVPKENGLLSEYDWGYNLSGGFIQNSLHTCSLNANFVVNIECEMFGTTRVFPEQICIMSTNKPPSQHCYYQNNKGQQTVYIPQIEIFWGCHGRGTLVRLAQADGKTIEKPVEEIQQGDVLLGFGGKKLVVSAIMTGEDTSIYRIQTRSGREIKVSGGHAMKSWTPNNDQGQRVTAVRLKTGDCLMTEAGREEIVFVGEESYHDTVYNFTFEGEQQPNYVLANGFWSGDFYAQNQEEKKTLVLTEETKEIVQDMKRLSEKMSENRVSCGETLPE